MFVDIVEIIEHKPSRATADVMLINFRNSKGKSFLWGYRRINPLVVLGMDVAKLVGQLVKIQWEEARGINDWVYNRIIEFDLATAEEKTLYELEVELRGTTEPHRGLCSL